MFGSILLLTILEIIVLCFYWWNQKGKKEIIDVESVESVKNILEQEKLSLNIDIESIRKKFLEPSRVKIEKKLSSEYSELFEFIDQNIDLNEILNMETTIKNGCDPFLVDLEEMSPVRLLLSMHKTNDVRRINRYFLQVHQVLLPGGYFIAWAHTIRTHKKWIYSKFPRQIANAVYFFDFCFKRIMPKLPGLKKIYFALTKGQSRIISRAEVLGRLCFCGFEVIAEKDINMRRCFIVRKVKTPSLDQNPTYGPFISLKRLGFNKKIIYMYKFRTMHPYSEYLQK
ncbi:MAG: sugar transferase [Desulfobacula sp.]|nr:sugar transferase [Desulfobacula sp.]